MCGITSETFSPITKSLIKTAKLLITKLLNSFPYLIFAAVDISAKYVFQQRLLLHTLAGGNRNTTH